MKQSRELLLAILLAGVSFVPARSEAPASVPPVTDWSVETVVVTAHVPGPPFWHITKDKSEVWILGQLEPLPEGLKWDSGRLSHILEGAKAVMLPPRGQVGVFEGIWFLMWNGDVLRLPDGQKLEKVLPEPLRARFVSLRMQTKNDEDRYATYKPSIAGFMLEGDFLKAQKLSVSEPVRTVESLAGMRVVPVQTIATYPALQVVKEVPNLSTQGNLKCLSDALDDVATMEAHARPAADAWAAGDLAGIKAHYSDPKALDCLSQSASFNQLWERSVQDTVSAVDRALARPGKTVMVISIGELLRKNGVIERLNGQGLAIEGPGD